MDVRGAQCWEDGVRVLDALCGVRPVADIDACVKDQVGGAALETWQAILTFEVFPTRLGIGMKLIILMTHNWLQSLPWLWSARLLKRQRPAPKV